MDSDTPIFSSEFISNYGKWLTSMGGYSIVLLSYLILNSLFIIFFERIADPNIAFGNILENAPYFYIAANDFISTKITKVSSLAERKNARNYAVKPYDLERNDGSPNMIDRVIPRVFRIDNTTLLPPYNYITIPKECTPTIENDKCKTSIGKDTFFSYFITAITFVMWGYRQGFKMFSFWNAVLINQNDITYQLSNKFLLLFGWVSFLLTVLMTFFYSITWGMYSVLFQHLPSFDNYKVGSPVPMYLGFIAVILNSIIRFIWWILLKIFQLIVAVVAVFTGFLLWGTVIPCSIFFWVVYPILENFLYNYANSPVGKFWGYPSTDNVKNYVSIFTKIGEIFRQNIQFITFLMLVMIYYSATLTMDSDFTNGVGIVIAVISIYMLYRGFKYLVNLSK